MYRKSTLFLIAAFLVAEGIAIVALPSRMPRPWRMVTAGINLIAAAGVAVLAAQRRE